MFDTYMDALSMEILTQILETTPFTDIRSFAQTNRYNKTQTALYHKHTLVREIAKRGVCPIRLIEIMKSTGSVITGSIPLLLMFPQISSLPHDHISMMVGSDARDILLNLLRERCDFNVTRVERRPMWDNMRDPNLTEGIFTLTKATFTITITVSRTNHPIQPMFENDLTLDMNYVTPYGLTCAYPLLTVSRRSFLNLHKFPYHVPLSHLLYENAGFRIAKAIWIWKDFEDHECGNNGSCPFTVRSITDKDVMTVLWDEKPVHECRPKGIDGMMIWKLRGSIHCIDGQTRSAAFTVTRDGRLLVGS
ncbi:uncharacterized protein LACBIDRAFT_314230 [Laccaria bicolor S238N-H82]|uniref:Predicted protein n=1 Tax=Laccaria bicolor (strain S238N-H82 / ATCC MYA-4686) TaxID=486041 RepID=B0D1V7_LACBS|nr:uncharacterized protein LACBIDRAFT_314230 [Laccaria bicolor S238N-H82]EDR11710.1 predicted protein [Laccaria bicolor S238N-H82]|eukprot:XP_001877607.1 predicted protein [Laccaria bicolor S238N-H82]